MLLTKKNKIFLINYTLESSDKSIRIWDQHSGKSINTLNGHTCELMAVVFSPDGQQITSGKIIN